MNLGDAVRGELEKMNDPQHIHHMHCPETRTAATPPQLDGIDPDTGRRIVPAPLVGLRGMDRSGKLATDEFIASCDVVQVLRERLAADEQFIRDRHGDCREYPQHARVEFVGELIDKYEHWADKAESWFDTEDYCNERAAFLNELLLVIANNWQDYSGR